MLNRRDFVGGAGNAVLLAASGPALATDTVTLPFTNGERSLARYPQKRPLIRLTARPPQLETPFAVFDEGVLTPNDAFFVRYHMAQSPPADLDPDTYVIEIKGKVKTSLKLSLTDLKKKYEPVEVVAVNQCSGNSRGFSHPRVGGGQLGNGAMGNARWRGVPLKAILDKAGVVANARQVVFNGGDAPAIEATPDFVKALDIDHARDGEVMIAYAMNGADLPVLNGYPVRLVVPGYYGTYWIKHLTEITVVDGIYDGFWMKTGYRIPANDCACVPAGTKPAATVPINRLNVRSFITNLSDGARLKARRDVVVRGIAFDGGHGISEVALSVDDGRNWCGTTLGKNFGRYSFRQWQTAIRLPRGAHELKVRAVNRIGETQPMTPLWNPAGYMRNAVETIRVQAA